MNSSKQSLALINSSEQNLRSDIWTIVSTYLEFRDKIALRGVCVNARKHNHILELPGGLETKLTVETILSIEGLKNLTFLNASSNPKITDKSIEKLTQLRTLNASGNPKITDKSVETLIQLRKLGASYNPKITDKCIEKLKKINSSIKIFK